MFKIGDNIIVHDRKMKTNSFKGEILGIDETLEKVKIYMVEIIMLDKDDKKTGKKSIVNLLKNQIIKDNNV